MVLDADRDTRGERRFSPSRLAKLTGITRNTIRKALSKLADSGWKFQHSTPTEVQDQIRAKGQIRTRVEARVKSWAKAQVKGEPDSKSEAESSLTRYSGKSYPNVRIPIALITDRSVPVQARVLYGVLQQIPGFQRSNRSGEFTYASLGKLAGLQARTVRKWVFKLAEAGWLQISQAHRRAMVRFRLTDPQTQAGQQELIEVKRRVDKGKYLGETLMREFLSQIVKSDEFEDDAAPGFLVNPLTGERLQLDRYYPSLGVAFEFNGPHHYGATASVSAEEAKMQRVRDLIKTGICAQRGITVVVVHEHDLQIETMRKKIGNLLPVRDVDYNSPVIRYLESRSRRYRRFARRASWYDAQ